VRCYASTEYAVVVYLSVRLPGHASVSPSQEGNVQNG